MPSPISAPPGAKLERLWIYPINSLDGLQVPEATITTTGALRHDREFALFDAEDQYVNAKRHERFHLIRSEYPDPANPLRMRLTAPDLTPLEVNLDDRDEWPRAAQWFQSFFGFPIEIRRASQTGFPDDRERSGPTVLSRATLETVAGWLPPIGADELARRLRANLELSGVPAFFEDGLIAEDGVPFRIGDCRIVGLHPCARCAVPTRHPESAEITKSFSKQLTARRKAELPEWSDPARFKHYYVVSTNTRIPESESGKQLRAGDTLSVG